MDTHGENGREKESKDLSLDGQVSRRQFLKLAGFAGGAVAVGGGLGGLLAGCGGDSTTTTAGGTASTGATGSTGAGTGLTPKYGGTLRSMWLAVDPNIGWPAEMTAGKAATVLQACMETLLRGDNKGNLIPWLAESFKVADDLKSITFAVRKGVKFHDGSDFNAEVAKWNLDNYITAKAEPNWASVDILDDYSIRVNFTEWTNTLPISFGDAPTFTAFMVSKAAFDKNGVAWMKGHPVGTGPFKFASFKLSTYMKFVKNTDYWVKGKPYLDAMETTFSSDSFTQEMAFKAGEADMGGISSAKEASEYAAMRMTAKTIVSANQVLIPDTANVGSPWANSKIREAVEYAIDREKTSKALGYGYTKAPYQIPPRYSLAYNPDFTLGRKYDPAKAKQLLTEAGFSNGFKTTIIVCPMLDKNVALALQGDLALVGIKVSLDYPDMGKWDSYVGPSATWPKNAALYFPLPTGDINFIGGLQFMINIFGKSWVRTPELLQSYQAILSSTTVDIAKVRAVTDNITKDASLIPVFEGVSGIATQPYVVNKSLLERGNQEYYNTEDTWFNK